MNRVLLLNCPKTQKGVIHLHSIQKTQNHILLRVTGNQGEKVFPFETQSYWATFKQTLESHGFLIVTGDFGVKVDCLISMGPSTSALREARKNGIPKSRMALVIWEPPVVSRRLHSEIFQNKFGVVAAPNRNWIKNENPILFLWPQNDFKVKAISAKAWETREKRIVLIQANKISFHPQEQYTLRRLVIFGSHKSIIDVYGGGWSADFSLLVRTIVAAFIKHPTYQIVRHLKHIGVRSQSTKGTVTDKELISSKYQIALVIENSPDYMSEKLFEALNAQNLVLYVSNFSEFPINPYGLLNLSPELSLIEEAISVVINLSVEERYKIMIEQRRILNEFPVFSRDRNPMNELANALSINLKK
jgi:hypothetical protein